jgi:intraflagellar transport protein 80
MGKKQSTSQSERFALACTDGRILLVSRSGRVENTIDGHKGAVLGVQWAHDGTALLSFGEDGAVKIWSKAGMLRSVLAQNGNSDMQVESIV